MKQPSPTLASLPAPAEPLLPVVGLAASAQDAAVAIVRRAASKQTEASYRSAAAYWMAWHRARYGVELALPLAETTVIQFVVDHVLHTVDGGQTFRTDLPAAVEAQLVSAGHKARAGAPALATVEHRLAFMAAQHRAPPYSEQPNPCRTDAVRKLMRAARGSYAKDGRGATPKDALDAQRLEQLLATCEEDIEAPCPDDQQPQPRKRGQATTAQSGRATQLAGLRDRALLLFAFSSGGRRRSEVTAATLANTRCVEPATEQAHGTWIFTLAHSKTNQGGEIRPENRKPIVGRAAAALEEWIAVSAAVEGPIFRKISKWGLVTAEPLTPAAVRDVVKRRCVRAGLESDAFSAHSLRSGFVTEAGKRKLPIAEGMAMSGHRSLRTYLRYYRLEQAEGSEAARLMDRDGAGS